jgi:hypothetical protein
MDWDTVAANAVNGLVSAGLNFGTAYGQQWLALNNLEEQYALQAQYAPKPAAPAGNGIVLILLVVGAVLLLRK